jgi:hypothetical protein
MHHTPKITSFQVYNTNNTSKIHYKFSLISFQVCTKNEVFQDKFKIKLDQNELSLGLQHKWGFQLHFKFQPNPKLTLCRFALQMGQFNFISSA